jgi:uncharacterized paraquat-inducible protein A
VTAEMTSQRIREHDRVRHCPACDSTDHTDRARHCQACGAALDAKP